MPKKLVANVSFFAIKVLVKIRNIILINYKLKPIQFLIVFANTDKFWFIFSKSYFLL